MALGFNALDGVTTGDDNIAIGTDTQKSNNVSTTISIGTQANELNTQNGTIAIGYQALKSNTGASNLAIGTNALASNTSGSGNVALGGNAMQFNTTGINNQAQGFNALASTTTGLANTALGNASMRLNNTGGFNTAVGAGSLNANIIGSENTVVGQAALAQMSSTIASLGTITGGSGYTDGTYNNVTLFAQNHNDTIPKPATIVVSGGQVISVTMTGTTRGVRTTTILHAPNINEIGGTGSGFSVPVTAVGGGGNNNVVVGRNAANGVTTGSNNTYLGTYAGQLNDNGSGNVFIGNAAGQNVGGANNQLIIANSNTTTPLIAGDFSAGFVKINGALLIDSSTPASSTANGNAGRITWDQDYIYVCVATNTWKRAALSSW